MAALTRFARVLESLQQSGDTSGDVFVAVRQFREATAELTRKASQTQPSQVHNWEEETTLWDLINVLYEFRFRLETGDLQPYPEFPYTALRLKQENYMLAHPELKELEIVIHWLQRTIASTFNDDETDADSSVLKGEKWQATAAEVGNLLNFNFIDHLDVDAPIRTNKLIHPADEERDSSVFRLIYRLVLAGNYEEASVVANDTGNFALALILVGALNEYHDPEIDGDVAVEVPKLALGVKDKLTWKRTTYELSRLPGLNRYERMIYSALVGGDITENIDEAQGSWEQTLLLYCLQLLAYRLEQFWIEATGANVEPCTPPPQFSNISQIIQTLTDMLNELNQASQDGHRVLFASVIQGYELNLFADTANHTDRLALLYLRIVTHMAIVYQQLFGTENDDDAAYIHQTTTNLIDAYTARLHRDQLDNCVVIYYSFVTDETQRRELLLRFLSQVPANERQPLLRKWQDILADMSLHPGEQEMAQTENVIHHMAQSALDETKAYYQPEEQFQLDDLAYDDEDARLISAVDSYYVNGMYYHFINASLHVIRRFLSVGKIAAFAHFAESTDKNLNKILKEYDRQTIGEEGEDVLDHAQRDEFEQYIHLADGLRFIRQFDDFAAKKAWNSGHDAGNGDAVEHSIEKVTLTLTRLIQTWFRKGSVTGASKEANQLFKSFRHTFVPYLIIRLLVIFVTAREKDWRYMARAFDLIDSVADDSNDYLECFKQGGLLPNFMAQVSEVATIALERGVNGLFPARG